MSRLEAILWADPEAELLYLEHMQVQSDPIREFGGARAGTNSRDDDSSLSGLEEDPFPTGSSEVGRNRRRSHRGFMFLIAAAAIILTTTLALMRINGSRPLVRPPPACAACESRDTKPPPRKVDVARGIALVCQG